MKNLLFLLLSAMLIQGCKDEESDGCHCGVEGSFSTGFDSTIVFPRDTGTLVLGVDTTLFAGNAIQFVLPPGAWTSYLWFGSELSCSSCSGPFATPSIPGTYTYQADLFVSIGDSYTFRSSITVIQNPNALSLVYIPNAFTPNGDGANDLYQVSGSGIAVFHLVIKDGGTQVFETFDQTEGWDGEVNGSVPDCSNFDYVVDVAFYDGSTKHYEGEITLFKSNGNCPASPQNCRFNSQFDPGGFNPNLPTDPINCN